MTYMVLYMASAHNINVYLSTHSNNVDKLYIFVMRH